MLASLQPPAASRGSAGRVYRRRPHPARDTRPAPLLGLRSILGVLLLACVARADILESTDCVVYFEPPAAKQARHVFETFRWRRENASLWLGVDSTARADIHFAADLAAMRGLVPGAPSWSVAVTSGQMIVLRLDRVDRDPANSLDTVLKHEVVHFVLNALPARLPRWFEEGLAVHNAGLAYLEPDTTLERYAAAGTLPRLADADRLFAGGESEAALGYKVGQRAIGAIVRRFGDDAIRRVVRGIARREGFDDAFLGATGASLEGFEDQWRKDVTPVLPFWLFVVAENLELALLCAAGLIVAIGYLLWRLRRERALAGLGGGGPTAPPSP